MLRDSNGTFARGANKQKSVASEESCEYIVNTWNNVSMTEEKESLTLRKIMSLRIYFAKVPKRSEVHAAFNS